MYYVWSLQASDTAPEHPSSMVRVSDVSPRCRDCGLDCLGGRCTILSWGHYTGGSVMEIMFTLQSKCPLGSTSQVLTLWSPGSVELLVSFVISFWPLCLGFPCVESRMQGMLWTIWHPERALPCSWVFTLASAKDPRPHDKVITCTNASPHYDI